MSQVKASTYLRWGSGSLYHYSKLTISLLSVQLVLYNILRFDSFLLVELITNLLKVVIKVLTIESLKSCTIRLVK